jgi:hypothetical protein
MRRLTWSARKLTMRTINHIASRNLCSNRVRVYMRVFKQNVLDITLVLESLVPDSQALD